MRVAIFASQPSFIMPIANELAKNHEIRIAKSLVDEEMLDVLKWADIAWFEWCDQNIIQASRLDKVCPIICRVHSYEVFTDMPVQVNWSKVDVLVFVSDHILKIFQQKTAEWKAIIGQQEKSVRDLFESETREKFTKYPDGCVISNAINLAHLRIPDDKTYGGKAIAFAGYINTKKNPGLMLYCFKKIHEWDSDFTLHIAGSHQDERVKMYMRKFVDDNKLPVVFHGWIDDLQTFYANKDFAISTSYLESFCFGIAEPMACGVYPLVHRWIGAERLWPDDCLFSDPDACLKLVQGFEKLDDKAKRAVAQRNRNWIGERYELVQVTNDIEELLDNLAEKKRAYCVDERTDYKAGITAYMICRDEEKGIGKALDSVKELCEEAVVLVDDKTTDRTAEIARQKGARVYPYTWTDDFSAARNLALSHVDTEWAFILDGHEYVKGKAADLIKRVKGSEGQVAGFYLYVHLDADLAEIDVEVNTKKMTMRANDVFRSIRLHRTRGAKWSNPVHNVVYVEGPILDENGVIVVHDRVHGQSAESRARRTAQRHVHLVSTLTRRVLENQYDTRSMFYLGHHFWDLQEWVKAYYWFDRYNRCPQVNQWEEEVYHSIIHAGRCAFALGDMDSVKEYAMSATLRVPLRAEGWALLGDHFFYDEKYEGALSMYERAESLQLLPNLGMPFDPNVHAGGFSVLVQMAECIFKLGNREKAVEIARKALVNENMPDNVRERVEANVRKYRGEVGGKDAK